MVFHHRDAESVVFALQTYRCKWQSEPRNNLQRWTVKCKKEASSIVPERSSWEGTLAD